MLSLLRQAFLGIQQDKLASSLALVLSNRTFPRELGKRAILIPEPHWSRAHNSFGFVTLLCLLPMSQFCPRVQVMVSVRCRVSFMFEYSHSYLWGLSRRYVRPPILSMPSMLILHAQELVSSSVLS